MVLNWFFGEIEFAFQTARALVRGVGAPTLPGPLDDGDLLAQAEERDEVLEPWWSRCAVEAKAAKDPAERSIELLKAGFWCRQHQTTTGFCGCRYTKSPVAMQGAVEDPSADEPPSSAEADSHCHFCQQEIRQLEDGLWFHTGRNMLRCADIPDYMPTYATPNEPNK